MKIELFDYNLPDELIAQVPSRKRDQSRLMVLDRSEQEENFITGVYPFKKITDYFQKGDALVVNNTKVFKARLLGKRKTGAQVEIFLIRESSEMASGDPSLSPKAKSKKSGSPLKSNPRLKNVKGQNYFRKSDKSLMVTKPSGRINRLCLWEALVQPSRRLNEGEMISFDGHFVLLREYYGGGRWQVEFRSQNDWNKIVQKFGHVPLPQYIKRSDDTIDIRRYQTRFADSSKVGAVAAPTAGFHFTKPILDALRKKGVKIVELTLHVGPGTFKPVSADTVEEHSVDPEYAELSRKSALALNSVRKRGGRIFAVGTTSTRTLESVIIKNGEIQPFAGMVDLYIKPGYKFRVVDHLLTNFHLPRSSLLILVSAFAGRERMLAAYENGIKNRMRFYSYGDCMLIL